MKGWQKLRVLSHKATSIRTVGQLRQRNQLDSIREPLSPAQLESVHLGHISDVRASRRKDSMHPSDGCLWIAFAGYPQQIERLIWRRKHQLLDTKEHGSLPSKDRVSNQQKLDFLLKILQIFDPWPLRQPPRIFCGAKIIPERGVVVEVRLGLIGKLAQYVYKRLIICTWCLVHIIVRLPLEKGRLRFG